MKKLTVLLAALALAALAACGGKDPAPAGYDPQTTAQALLDSPAPSTQELAQLDADLVPAYLGLEDASPRRRWSTPPWRGATRSWSVLTMADEECRRQRPRQAAEAHVAAQTETETEVQYKPEDLPKLKDAVVRQAGSTVVLVVAADYDAVSAVLDGNG